MQLNQKKIINTTIKVENQIYQIMGYNKGVFSCKYLNIQLEKSIKLGKVWVNTLGKFEANINYHRDNNRTSLRMRILHCRGENNQCFIPT